MTTERRPASERFAAAASELATIADELFRRGRPDEGVEALAVAAHYLKAARSFETMENAARRYGGTNG
jgi:hypothetical protein